jgi:hypothetical protein
MKLVTLPRYVKHSEYGGSNPLVGGASTEAHAMMRGPAVVVDVNAFLYAYVAYDAFYPDEPDSANDALVTAMFAKGAASIDIRTKASELARVLGRTNLPGNWFGR